MEKKHIENVEDMPVYRLFYELALKIETMSRPFRSDFKWLRSQLLRASESVCANMTEGFYSQYSTEYLQSLHRCRREARETFMHLNYAKDTHLLTAGDETLFSGYEDALHQLGNLITSIERKIQLHGKSKPANASPASSIDHQPLTIDHSS
ncbi:MAG: four helix bundle protein [Kiritimatiellae bacterium]|nr:four helix bundle protein [Verrucomicrobiota bacterium]MBU4286152.1 four helix bundle protein [Verrucomicrobiota bacterium]MBU4366098.1 four helix bundle protein [Verrucomicrobiota bacterium]MCG2660515.1 four helix bundle protein [Kiritimatiellia bacterium]